MRLTVCPTCTNHLFTHDKECPHCGANRATFGLANTGKRAALTLLMGLATLTACGEDEKDDSAESSEPAEETSEPAIEPAEEVDYGVPDLGEEQD